VLNYVRQHDHIKSSEIRCVSLQCASFYVVSAQILVCRLSGVNRIFQSGYVKATTLSFLKHIAMTGANLEKTHAGYIPLLFRESVGTQIFELQSCGTILQLANVIMKVRVTRKTYKVIGSIYFIQPSITWLRLLNVKLTVLALH